jgi:hypothetical protein
VSLAVTLAWIVLLLIHVMPAAAAFSPRLRKRMYGVEENGVLGVILAHRGFLFLAVAAACAYAAFDTASRPLATIVTAISVLGFLALYVLAGSPKALRQIAVVDLIGVPPLVFVFYDAWRAL